MKKSYHSYGCVCPGCVETMGSIPSTDQQDYDMGLQALKWFHDQASKYPEHYEMTFDQLVQYIKDHSGGNDSIIRAIGLAYFSQDIGDWPWQFNESDLKSGMEKLADTTQGLLPANVSKFYQVVAINPDDWDLGDLVAASYKATADAVPVAVGNALEAAAGVGEGLLTTLKSMKYVLPILGIGALAYIVYSNSKKVDLAGAARRVYSDAKVGARELLKRRNPGRRKKKVVRRIWVFDPKKPGSGRWTTPRTKSR